MLTTSIHPRDRLNFAQRLLLVSYVAVVACSTLVVFQMLPAGQVVTTTLALSALLLLCVLVAAALAQKLTSFGVYGFVALSASSCLWIPQVTAYAHDQLGPYVAALPLPVEYDEPLLAAAGWVGVGLAGAIGVLLATLSRRAFARCLLASLICPAALLIPLGTSLPMQVAILVWQCAVTWNVLSWGIARYRAVLGVGCPICGCDLGGLSGAKCPECGSDMIGAVCRLYSPPASAASHDLKPGDQAA